MPGFPGIFRSRPTSLRKHSTLSSRSISCSPEEHSENTARLKAKTRKQMKLLLLLATTFALLSCGTNSPQSTLKKPSYTTKTNASFNLPSCAGSLSEQAQRRTFAAPPRLKASDIHSTYWPLLTALGKKTNICFEIKHHQKH